MRESKAMILRAGICSLALIALTVCANGQVPTTISYQAFLLEPDGKAVPDGSHNLRFRIYDALEDGTLLWEENHYGVPVEGGRFSVVLGSNTSLGTLAFDEPYWLEIAVDGGPSLVPRIEFTSSAYSLMARSVEDDAVSSAKILDGAVGPDDIGTDVIDSSKISAGGISFSDIGQNVASEGQVIKWNGSEWLAADDDSGSAGASIECSDCDDRFLNNSGDETMTGVLAFNNPGGPTNILFKVNEETRGWVKGDPDFDRIEFHANGYYLFTSDITDAIEGRTTAEKCSGVIGTTEADSSAGVSGYNDGSGTGGIGVAGYSGVGKGVYGWSETGWAGYFDGDLYYAGSLSGPVAGSVIDHPLDPENMHLAHSFIGSPDMKNFYDGVAELDSRGVATVELPRYFDALNGDFRYQLTCIGGYAPVYIAHEIENNRFMIAGGQPGMRVSWQVTGIRKDSYARQSPVEVESPKPARAR